MEAPTTLHPPTAGTGPLYPLLQLTKKLNADFKWSHPDISYFLSKRKTENCNFMSEKERMECIKIHFIVTKI
jgi:hypothetical protein